LILEVSCLLDARSILAVVLLLTSVGFSMFSNCVQSSIILLLQRPIPLGQQHLI
jgi:hypothetical protein